MSLVHHLYVVAEISDKLDVTCVEYEDLKITQVGLSCLTHAE